MTKHGNGRHRPIENDLVIFIPDLDIEGVGAAIKIIERDNATARNPANSFSIRDEVGSVALAQGWFDDDREVK